MLTVELCTFTVVMQITHTEVVHQRYTICMFDKKKQLYNIADNILGWDLTLRGQK